MNLGKMDRLATLERQFDTGETSGSLGQPVYEWRPVTQFWVQQIAKSEDEQFYQDVHKVIARRRITFRTHYLEGVLQTDRLVVDGLTYNIQGIRELGYRAGLELTSEWIQ